MKKIIEVIVDFFEEFWAYLFIASILLAFGGGIIGMAFSEGGHWLPDAPAWAKAFYTFTTPCRYLWIAIIGIAWVTGVIEN